MAARVYSAIKDSDVFLRAREISNLALIHVILNSRNVAFLVIELRLMVPIRIQQIITLL